LECLGFARERADGRYEITEAGAARHAEEIAPTIHEKRARRRA
jgi:hypothetical protein